MEPDTQQSPPMSGPGSAPKDQIPGHPSFRRFVEGVTESLEYLLRMPQAARFTSLRGKSHTAEMRAAADLEIDMPCAKGSSQEFFYYLTQRLMIDLGPMRRCEPRRTVHQLYGLLNRMQDTNTEAEEDGHEEGDRQVRFICVENHGGHIN